MNLKDYFESIDLDEIENFVKNEVSEDLYLEFKTANFPAKTNFDLKNFSKCLSGFSNSSGGIIVWGVKASTNEKGVDAAKSLKPIEELAKFENYLKRNEGKAVIPFTDEIQYKRIESSKDKGYLIVLVLPSESSPHMANFSDKHYYKRSGDSFYICEHFDIMDMMNRKIVPKLVVEIKNENITVNPRGYNYESIFCIKNIGKVSANQLYVFLRVKPPFRIATYGIDGNGTRGMKTTPTKDNFKKYFGGTELVIHPDTYHEVDKISLNELGFGIPIDDLVIEYRIIAEGMKLEIGTITRKKEDLLKEIKE